MNQWMSRVRKMQDAHADADADADRQTSQVEFKTDSPAVFRAQDGGRKSGSSAAALGTGHWQMEEVPVHPLQACLVPKEELEDQEQRPVPALFQQPS